MVQHQQSTDEQSHAIYRSTGRSTIVSKLQCSYMHVRRQNQSKQ